MAIKLDQVRSGARLISAAMRIADSDYGENKNGKVSAGEVARFVENYDDPAIRHLGNGNLEAVLRFAQARYQTRSPTLKQINRSLAEAMRQIARADTDRSGRLNKPEQATLSKTARAIVDFSERTQGMTESTFIAHGDP